MYIVLESILFVLTEGCSWRAIDRPEGRWNSVYQYFRRWCQRGTLQKVLTQFGPELAPGWHFVDSTHVKVRRRLPFPDRDHWRVSKRFHPVGRARRAYDMKTTMFPGILCKPFCPVFFDILDRP